jgi:hypothetical protein
MSKYIKNYSQILNENTIGMGSVLLILGKPNSSGLRKVYATQIRGSIEIKPGVRRFILGDIFYIIKFIDGEFRIIKIDYRAHDDLKRELSIKAPGNISIVQHYNKTPFHKRTLKYTDIRRALSDVKFDLLGENYLLESIEINQKEDSFFYFSNIIIEKVFNTAFLGDPECKIIDYNIDDSIEDYAYNVDYSTTQLYVDWDIEFNSHFKQLEIREFLQEWNLDIIPKIVFSLKSDLYLKNKRDYEVEIINCETSLYECYIDGTPVKLTTELESKINKTISSYDYQDALRIIEKNLAKNHIIKLNKD